MLVNGKVRRGCTALVDQLDRPITLEPATKFPVVRDLMVDRSRMFGALKRVHAWSRSTARTTGSRPRASKPSSSCGTRSRVASPGGCCLEVCPQVSKDNDFVGAAAIGQTLLQNLHPTGQLGRDERLDALMGPGGIADCGNAQNCVAACPKDIPLTEAIAEMGRQTTLKMLRDMFRR